MAARSKALFLDRDGVINQEVGYLHAKEQVRWVEGIFELCRAAAELGYKLVVVTNQAGIARGYYTEAQFQELMEWMQGEFEGRGLRLDAVYFCPFHPDRVKRILYSIVAMRLKSNDFCCAGTVQAISQSL